MFTARGVVPTFVVPLAGARADWLPAWPVAAAGFLLLLCRSPFVAVVSSVNGERRGAGFVASKTH